jgi:membrane fusion protein (multidrug efflux system)
LALARTIFERQERLWKKNIGSEIEYLQAKNNKEGLEMKLETLREQLNLTKILAPIEGMVDNVLIKEGEMAAAGFGAFRIVQLSLLKITASLAENYIPRVKKGDVVRVLVPVIDREFDQTVGAVSQVIDPDNRTFEIEIQVPRSERDLKPNMLAVITINDYSSPDALVVPQNIVQETGSSKFLFVAVEAGGIWKAERREVKTGESFDNQVEVLTGIQPGEHVITLGFQSLADGQSIQPDNGN